MTKETSRQKNKPLPMAYIQEHLRVCPESPSGLKWVTKGHGRLKPGSAGGLKSDGRFKVKVQGKIYFAHRLIYALTQGTDPGAMLVDHQDGDPNNNHPSNLRQATHSQNNQNRRRQVNNKTGSPGVSWERSRNRWRAVVDFGGRQHVKRFKVLEEATAWVITKRLELFGEFAPENRQGPIENTAQVTTEPAQACLFD